ncbi:SLOG family protein [Virgibacillus sp. M23]|uniref:SLOG family protein n=1 Tax=Virgibacillus sp. M23 TaxID=3079030 RepID=UPI002A90C740|nr:SLOG family protein [Virgibacillus sp. M23]MDY7043731.1 SLOG family protein [Virgibacillus sp. M23]
MANKTACFTGHRPSKLRGYNPEDNIGLLMALKDNIVDHIEEKNVTNFISGMALGTDIWSAMIVLKLKSNYPKIKLVCAIPCLNQYSKWVQKSIDEWRYITKMADRIHYISKESYTPWCMQRRNEWMVDNSSYVIGVWDGTNGGTKNCIQYATKKGVSVTRIHPKTLEIYQS